MLEKNTQIEGLEAYDDVEVYDDTPPGVTQVKFELLAEEMPYLTAQAGHIVRKNFVWITKVMDLGRTVLNRRIYDSVEYDDVNQKWKVRKLGNPSDIKRYPDQWNAFTRGTKLEDIGTPLSILFKTDPARAEMYKSRGIYSLEQLAAMSDTNCQDLGMGAKADRERALSRLEKINAQAPRLMLDTMMEEKDKKIEDLNKKVDALLLQLNKVMTMKAPTEGTGSPGRPPGRPKKSSLIDASDDHEELEPLVSGDKAPDIMKF